VTDISLQVLKTRSVIFLKGFEDFWEAFHGIGVFLVGVPDGSANATARLGLFEKLGEPGNLPHFVCGLLDFSGFFEPWNIFNFLLQI